MLDTNEEYLFYISLELRRFHFTLFEKQSASISISDRKTINLSHKFIFVMHKRGDGVSFIPTQ